MAMIGGASAIAPIVLGFLLIALIFQDVFEVLLLPRRVRRRWRLAGIFFRVTWLVWRKIASLFRPATRASFLSIYGPLSIVTLYVAWASSLIVGFGLCQWGLNRHAGLPTSLFSDLYLSGSTFFTLGFGDVTPHTGAAKVVSIMEAGSGFGLIAAVIGYLPVLYQLFSRREAPVIQLDGRAGSPPSAAFLLVGHGADQAMAEFNAYLRGWEMWGAELLESHLSYPMLVFYRSQHDNQSWLGALSTIMDACAIVLSGLHGARTFQARMTFAMGRMVIIEMTRVMRLQPITPQPDRLSSLRFAKLAASLAEAGLALEGPAVEARLTALRITYEPLIEALSRFLLLPVPDWLPAATPDNWQMGAYGGLAVELVDGPGSPSFPLVEMGADETDREER
jgi:Ion channel